MSISKEENKKYKGSCQHCSSEQDVSISEGIFFQKGVFALNGFCWLETYCNKCGKVMRVILPHSEMKNPKDLLKIQLTVYLGIE